jgi:hypothetical protein
MRRTLNYADPVYDRSARREYRQRVVRDGLPNARRTVVLIGVVLLIGLALATLPEIVRELNGELSSPPAKSLPVSESHSRPYLPDGGQENDRELFVQFPHYFQRLYGPNSHEAFGDQNQVK